MGEKKEHKYIFSVVMPIYNVEDYLSEAIESVINQTIGFEKNIQLILVNDGSTDGSEKICLNYEKKYPDNIVYIKQKNGGVSVARNTGIKYVEGKYVNFIDSDDKWSLKTFEYVNNFFKKHEDEVDVVAARIEFFGQREGYHALDYKFKKTKIVNIFENYNYIHMNVAPAFIKAELVKKYQFDSKLKYGEDTKYVSNIIFNKNKYGVIREAVYYYRRRMDSSSAMQGVEDKKVWYTETLNNFHNAIIELSKERFGTLIPYAQYLLMYDLQWRIRRIPRDILTDEEKKEYIQSVINILKQIDDYIICEQKDIFAEYKKYALELKYNKDISSDLKYIKGKMYFNNTALYKIRNNKSMFKIDILEIRDDKLIIEGRVSSILPKEFFDIYVNINSKERKLIDLQKGRKSIYGQKDKGITGQVVNNHYTYKVEIPLKDAKKINIIFVYKKQAEIKLNIKFGKMAKLNQELKSYFAYKDHIIKYRKKDIFIEKNKNIKNLKHKYVYTKELIKNKEVKVIGTRLLYYMYKLFNRKEIWLISDREDMAKDNGEAFFEYMQNIKNKKIKTYFLIEKNSDDYKRMKKIGKVIKLNTLKHKIYFLMASKIISSHASDFVVNAFKDDEIYYRDLMTFDFIFLQHGITKDDLSDWLKKYNKNIKLFVTAAKDEYKSIIEGDYYYTENEVKLTGFPRYDKLVDKKQKKILILPTYRKKLAQWNAKDEMGKTYNPKFKESEYYKFFNKLINDKRILDVVKEKGYVLQFALHPALKHQISDFDKNENVQILESVNYQKEFAENALMITDFSSVAFDFAYLKKPVIYAQFDKEQFFKGHAYEKGYFDYDKDGFGAVCYDYETTVKQIVDTVKNDCKLEKKYLERIKKFYYKVDTDNCKRVYEEILKL